MRFPAPLLPATLVKRYKRFLADVVLPHAVLFAQLSRWGEVLIGCALVLGLFTRLAAFCGVALALNYLPANAVWNHSETVADILGQD